MAHSDRRFLTATILLLAITCAACSKDSTSTATTTPPSCVVTAGAITASAFSAAGGTGSVPVTAAAGCAWTASSSATFVAITSGATGNGNGTVAFTVESNAGAARSATLTVGGTTNFTITQSAAAPPPAPVPPGTLSAPTASSPVRGETVNVPRPVLVVNNALASGNVGPVTYRFEVSDLPTFPNEPVRTFTVDGIPQGAQTTAWTLNRDLGPDVLWYWHARATDGIVTSAYSPTETFRTPTTCTYAISPTSVAVNNTSADLIVTVTTKSGCAWTAATTSSFITIVSGASGSGSGSVFITISENVGPQRTDIVTIAGQTFTVTQAAP